MELLEASISQKRPALRLGVLTWFSSHGRDYPWREKGRTPYEILVAELLLKRTTATSAAKVYDQFLSAYPDLEAMASASEEELVDALGRVGLYRQRARAIANLSAHLIEEADGAVPDTLERLLTVPGIGAYSARAILSFGFDIREAVVDNNVARILKRVFKAVLPEKPSMEILQRVADELIPTRLHREANFGLLDLAALVCRRAVPRCSECPLNEMCDLSGEQTTEYPSVYSALRELRLANGVSLVSLSQLSGVSKLTIINIEANRTRPRPATLEKLKAALEVGWPDTHSGEK